MENEITKTNVEAMTTLPPLKNPNKEIRNKIKSLSPKKLIAYGILAIVILGTIGYFVLDTIKPFTKDGAKNYLKGKGIAINSKSAFEYGRKGDNFTINLLIKSAPYLASYSILGSVGVNDSYKKIISQKIDLTEHLTEEIESVLISKNCPTLLQFLNVHRILLNYDDIKQFINNSSIGDKNDCSVVNLLSKNIDDTEQREIANLVIDKTGLAEDKDWLLKMIKGGNTIIVPILENKDKKIEITQDMLDASTSMSHEMHDSHDHDKVEFEIVKAVFQNASNDKKNENLAFALKKSKFNIAGAIIDAGGNYNTVFTTEGYNSESYSVIDYAIKFKKDSLLSAIANSGYKFDKNITYKDSNGKEVVEGFLAFCLGNNLPLTSKVLIKKGVNFDTKYKPSSSSSKEYPLIFSVAFNEEMVDLLPAIQEKEDVLGKLTTEEKNQFLAILLYTFSKNPTSKSLESIQTVGQKGFDFNAKILYENNSTIPFAIGSVPVWATPLIAKSSSYSKISDKEKVPFNTYFNNLIKDGRITSFDFTKDRQTSIGIATRLELTSLVTKMLDNGINPNSVETTTDQNPILVTAIKVANLEMVDVLLDRKADPNFIIKQSYSEPTTPLMVAIENSSSYEDSKEKNNLLIIKSLIVGGANVNMCTKISDQEENCPLSLASNKNSKSELVAYLTEKGAKCKLSSNKYCIKN
jgi:Ankyrin repeat